MLWSQKLLKLFNVDPITANGPDGRYFLAARVVSKSIVADCMPDRYKICPNGRVLTHREVQPEPANQQTSFSGRGNACGSNLPFLGHIVITFQRPTILQLNIGGLTARKMKVFHHLAVQHEALAILLQEIHCYSSEKLTLPSFALAGLSLSRKHGLATFVHEQLKYTLLNQFPLKSEIECLCVDVDGFKIVNVYKPPPTRLQASDLPVFPPCLYVGDFNGPHADWSYDANSVDGEWLGKY